MKKMFLPMALGLLSTCCMSCEVSAMINRGLTVQQCRDNARAASHLSGALAVEGVHLDTTVDSIAKGARALQEKGYGADGSNLPNKPRAEVETDIQGADALAGKGYARNGSDLPNKSRAEVETDIQGADALAGKGYVRDGSDLPNKQKAEVEAAVAFSELFEDAGNSYAHLNDISLKLWRAACASGLKVDMDVLRDSGNDLAKPDTVDTDDKMKDLPRDRGLTTAALQSATHDHDMVKFALLRGFFNSATYANHNQAALNAVNDVHCTDGDISLGAGGLELKVNH